MLVFDEDISPTVKGSRYFMIITDDYTRYRWFYTLKYKSDAYTKLKEWAVFIRTQFGKILKRIRTDSGGEWLN
jgi:hypothetical protein